MWSSSLRKLVDTANQRCGRKERTERGRVMDVKASNTAFVIEATAACCSRPRRRTFLGLMALCLFIFVGWPQALLAGEGELFKPERPEAKNPHYSSPIDVYRENNRALEVVKGIVIPKLPIEAGCCSTLRGRGTTRLSSDATVIAPGSIHVPSAYEGQIGF
jgi:hypothetical protein